MNVSVTNHLCFDNFTGYLVLILQLPMYVCVLHYVYAGTHKSPEDIGSPETDITSSCEPPDTGRKLL